MRLAAALRSSPAPIHYCYHPQVRLDALAPSDEHLIGLGVHLPLPLGAMEHFDLHSARHNRHGGTLDLGSARRAYRPVSQLEPEYLAWSADGSKVFVNLQENAAIVTVDVATATAERISPLGLTDWSAAGGTDGIDIVDDGACRLQHYEGLFSINSADTIGSFEVDGEVYVMAAMEGGRVRYGDFKEDQKLRSVVASNASFGKNFAAFRAPDGALQQVFDLASTDHACIHSTSPRRGLEHAQRKASFFQTDPPL